MYSGTTLTPLSGRIFGTHQKVDRLARIVLRPHLAKDGRFPDIKHILHFEGINGPDAIKRKSPAQDEPWHYYSPFDDQDTALINIIGDHYDRLVLALQDDDQVRAGFEAAWLAHAIVDGLTPAHHYPYEQKLTELRGGEGLETRNTIKNKLILPGETRRKQVKNNWEMWGTKGLMSTHIGFEWGIAALMAPYRPKQIDLSEHDIRELGDYGVLELFKRKAKEIDALGMYDIYQIEGWKPALARTARKKLIPSIVHMVVLA
ncbi:MAG TPA: hypothetical protein VLF43_02930, partial [Candidatus Saccharimonadales bacterium]|nr:hypothetical protein [Candidatus Saccharimonadales bacterium]